ncbi:MAG: YchJ family metal-binding protein [Mariprofundaceae bacterium]|nr:YchJ family metal-binding protein [Mariprofundaceae bacterium]
MNCASYLIPVPKQLMRSRYAAFVLGNVDYLLKTWHPDTRPKDFKLGRARWLGLTILHADGNTVHFLAAFHSGNKGMLLEETSRFVCMDQHWRYVDGDCTVTPIKRNAPCFCGSQEKYKRCCGKADISHPIPPQSTNTALRIHSRRRRFIEDMGSR